MSSKRRENVVKMSSRRQNTVNVLLKCRESLKHRHFVAQMTKIGANTDNSANDDYQT